MGTGYTRNDTGNNIADGNVINASDLDGEFDAIQSAFNGSTGHSHDGTNAEGGPVTVVGPAQDLVVSAAEVRPKTDNTLDLGTTLLEFKDAFFDGTVKTDNLTVDENATVTGNLTVNGNTTIGNAATDTVTVTADVASDLIPSADDTYDLGASGSEWKDLYIDGTANIDSLVADTADINGGTVDGADITVGAGKTLDVSAGTLTLANDQISGDKIDGGTIGSVTISSLTATSADINGGTIDGTVIGGTTPAAGSFTTGSFTGDVTFGDNDKAIFGAGSDLQIYHDGSNSIINDNGTGALQLQTGGSTKLATTATGIDVTGTVVSDGASLDGAVVINESGADVDFRVESDSDSHCFYVDGSQNQVRITTAGYKAEFESNGDGVRIVTDNSSHTIGISSGVTYATGLNYTFLKATGGASGTFDIVTNTNGVRLSRNATSWSALSDSRLKTVTGRYTDAITDVKELDPVKFTWNHDTENTPNVGFLAQSVQGVVPEAVVSERRIEGDNTEYLSVKYTEVMPLLTAALQEAITKIETLEARIAALENA